jgi:acyl-CoA thioesterase YciA
MTERHQSIETTTAPRGRLSIRTVAMPADTNPQGVIFGGWLLAQMDLAGGTHAFHRARGLVVTVAVEAMTFHEAVFVGDEVSCYTEVVRVGRSSIAVRVEAWVRRRWGVEEQIKVTSASFTFVAINEDRSKRDVPPEE